MPAMTGGCPSSKWGLLVACLWIQSCGGNSYNFALYSATLKEKLIYDQTWLDTLGVAKDVGGNVGLLSGILYALLPPWAILAIGAVENLVGYLGLWLAVTARVAPPPFWAANLFICLGTNGATFFNTAVLVTCLRSFPNSRGMVLGLLKGFIGLSGALFTQLYVTLVAPDQSAFLLLIAVVPAGVALLLSPCVRECAPTETREEQARETATLLRVIGVSLLVAGLLMGAMLTRELFPDHPRWSAVLSAAIFATLLSPLLIPLSAWYNQTQTEPPETRALLGSEGQRIAGAEAVATEDGGARVAHPLSARGPDVDLEGDGGRQSLREGEVARTSHEVPSGSVGTAGAAAVPARGEDHTLLHALRSTDFWLLCASQMAGAGCGLTAINNLAQLGAAFEQSSRVSLLVGLVSVWSFLACPFPGSLHLGSVLVGVSYGGQWALMAAVASELFGLAHFALLYNVLALGSPLATYLLSAHLAGWLYDREARRHPHARGKGRGYWDASGTASQPSSPPKCSGAHCFHLTFLILTGVCLVGAAFSGWLTLRTRRFYHDRWEHRSSEEHEFQRQPEEARSV